MSKDSKKTEIDLCLNYNALSEYTLGWLPFSMPAIQMAFPHLSVKAEAIPSYGSGTEQGFALYAKDATNPALCIDSDGDSGYAYCVTAHNEQALCLGQYRVGQTTLADFRDDQMTEAFFMLNSSSIGVMGGIDECGGPYSARFLFAPPPDWSGDLGKAAPDFWRTCIMSEARFYVPGRQIRPSAETNEVEGVKLLKKEELHKPAVPLQQGPNLADGNPIPLLKRSLYSASKARSSYLKLCDLAIYNAPVDSVKTNIKAIFKNHEEPDAVLMHISEMFNDEPNNIFMLNLDWKSDIINLAESIKRALGENVDLVTLPSLSNFPKNKSVSLAGVYEAYAKSLSEAGFDFWSMDSSSDHHINLITYTKNRKRVTKLFETTHLHNFLITFEN